MDTNTAVTVVYILFILFYSFMHPNGVEEGRVYCQNIRIIPQEHSKHIEYESYKNGKWRSVRRRIVENCISTTTDHLISHTQQPDNTYYWHYEDLPRNLPSVTQTYNEQDDTFLNHAYVPLEQGWLLAKYRTSYSKKWTFFLKIPELSNNQKSDKYTEFKFQLPNGKSARAGGRLNSEGYVELDFYKYNQLYSESITEEIEKIMSDESIIISFTPKCEQINNGDASERCSVSSFFDKSFTFRYLVSTRGINKAMNVAKQKVEAIKKQLEEKRNKISEMYVQQLPDKTKRLNRWINYDDFNQGQQSLINYKTDAYKKKRSVSAFFSQNVDQQLNIYYSKQNNRWLLDIRTPETINSKSQSDRSEIDLMMEVPGKLKPLPVKGILHIHTYSHDIYEERCTESFKRSRIPRKIVTKFEKCDYEIVRSNVEEDKTWGNIIVSANYEDELRKVIKAMKSGDHLIITLFSSCFYPGYNQPKICQLGTSSSFKLKRKMSTDNPVKYSFSLKGSASVLNNVKKNTTF